MMFDILLLGLDELIGNTGTPRGGYSTGEYHHSELLGEAMNRLSLAFLAEGASSPRFPHTLHGFIQLCHLPTGKWWPNGSDRLDAALPAGFENVPLMEKNKLSEEAHERLYDALDEENLPTFASARMKKSGLDNALLRDLIHRLRGEANAEQANKEYQLVRRFIIENPLPTTEEIRCLNIENRMRLVGAEEVGNFYSTDTLSSPVWVCERCGPLLENNGQLAGIKPEVCSDHWQSSSRVHKIDGKNAWGRRRLRMGLQLRTLIPGVPELDLFKWLVEQHQEHSGILVEVALWPGVDRYDYRLVWSDGDVWGVDFKDYKSPENLGRKLKTLPNEDPWSHEHSFYVFPARHLMRNPDYRTRALNQGQMPSGVQLLSDTQFQARVQERVAELKKEQRVGARKKTNSQEKIPHV